MHTDPQKILSQALDELKKVQTLDELKNLDVKFLGRKGLLTELLKTIKDMSDTEKKEYGQSLNKAKKALEQAIDESSRNLESKKLEKELSKEFFDITYPGYERKIGHIHVLSQIQEEIETIFSQMGFSIMDGPEIESEYYNFDSLNVPASHPARDIQDTFFVAEKKDDKHGRLVLRTQTSPVQVRTMEKYGAPLRVIIPGRSFRNEALDASHEHTFHQVEGLLVDENISIATLKGIMTEFLSRLFKKDVSVRFRPGYFPFVEPGIELDFSCILCGGKGCRVCKNSGWIEFMGSGMVHPNVLKAGGIDSEKYMGWAFGFGMDRLAMMRYGVTDIRLFQGGDLRFIKQF